MDSGIDIVTVTIGQKVDGIVRAMVVNAENATASSTTMPVDTGIENIPITIGRNMDGVVQPMVANAKIPQH
jgi:hypothetical protein